MYDHIRAIRSAYFNQENTLEMIEQLITRHLLLTQADLDRIGTDSEEYGKPVHKSFASHINARSNTGAPALREVTSVLWLPANEIDGFEDWKFSHRASAEALLTALCYSNQDISATK